LAFPLSFAQQRLWFLDQLVPANAFYNLPISIRSVYPLNVPLLERCLNEIVRRHESLRTTFSMVNGQPVQVVGHPGPVPLPVTDLSALPSADREVEARRLVDEEARRPFDLAKGPLLRCGVLRLGATDHLFLVTMHHIVSDGWSMGVFARELGELYAAFVVGRPCPLRELPVQYSDYAVWQRKRLVGELLEQQLQYWREKLQGISALQLPTDRPRPVVQSFRGASVPVELSPTLIGALRLLGQSESCTPFMTLLAGFNTLLSRYSGQEDVVVGVPVAGRDRAEVEGIIGFFVNTLVMRGDLSGNPSFRELLRRVREAATGAYAHQELPFEKLVEELQPERDLSRNPLFQVTFQLVSGLPRPNANVPSQALASQTSSASVNPHSITGERGSAVFDLGFNLWEGPDGGVQGYAEYSTDLFDADTVLRMTRHWRRILEAAAAKPDAPLLSLPLLSEAERQQMLVEWNQTDTDYPREVCVHELFCRQAELTPDAVAVACEDRQLTYRELACRAALVARRLIQRGVERGRVVGICLERSEQLVVGLLGILKCGATYLPLDPSYPLQRLAFMIENAQTCIVMTEAGRLNLFKEVLRNRSSMQETAGTATQVISLQELEAAPAVDPELDSSTASTLSEERSGATADDVAYVMYTSGTTGRPKGACIPHRAIIRLVKNSNYITLSSRDTVAQASSISFDAATFEIWGALLNGARLSILQKDSLLSCNAFSEQVVANGFTVLFLTTALFNQLVRQDPAVFRSFRCLLVGGEAADPEAVRQVLRAAPPQQLVHIYGPTENTTFSTWHLVREVPEGAVTVPLGHPISNTSCYVLDARMEPVPIGVSGELYLGGDGLACGYLNAPDLTAEKFVPDRFANTPGRRLYRTGDIVRRLAGGELAFVGRNDNQVKIRGFRVESGEVETVLAACPGVQEGVVLLRQDAPGQKRLVAYVVPKAGSAPSISELRQFVQEHLPTYMIPSVFIVLDTLPLTPSGKVDRRALPEPDYVRPDLQTQWVQPGTPAEKLLAQIWAQVLRLEKVGIHDNFFELGGDSILSIQIIGRAKQVGLHLTPQQLFQHQTVAGLAAVARASASFTIEQGPVEGAVPLTPVQCWFFEHRVANPHHFNQAVVLDAGTIAGPSIFRQALRALVAHHDALRLRFEPSAEGDNVGAYWRQANAAVEDAELLMEMDLSTIPKNEQQMAFDETATCAQSSLDISRGPLIRAVLFRTAQGQSSQLLIAIHHLAVDGVSWHILLEDLRIVLGQLSKGEPVQLLAKTTSFRDWSTRLSEHANTAALRNELTYWMKLTQCPSFRLPIDYPEAEHEPEANSVANAEDVTVALDIEKTRFLLQELPAIYRGQINDILLTALCWAFRSWTGQTALFVDLEGHGREPLFDEVDLTRTVGWFTSIFPVLLDTGATTNPEDALKQVKEQLRVVPGRGIGYGLLRYLTRDGTVRQTLAKVPKPLVSFNYYGQFQAARAGSIHKLLPQQGGHWHSLGGQRFHLLEINGGVQAERMQFTWTFNRRIHRQETIASLATDFVRVLSDMMAQCRVSGLDGYTPSDFSKARLSQSDLDKLLTRIAKGR
jgi:amino acid adenylation domain-containing protein/non-ribosomal peptide synthase protein (TIGR01720 family)